MTQEHPFSHLDETGASRLVDVSSKKITAREARAQGQVSMKPQTLQLILDQQISKGQVLEVARLAGIMAAKKTSDLIPLCHPLPIEHVQLDFQKLDESRLQIEARVTLQAKTGVEMEALTAVSVAALTIYDMCKKIDRELIIGPIQLVEKSGGQSGHFVRQPQSEAH